MPTQTWRECEGPCARGVAHQLLMRMDVALPWQQPELDAVPKRVCNYYFYSRARRTLASGALRSRGDPSSAAHAAQRLSILSGEKGSVLQVGGLTGGRLRGMDPAQTPG